ncbi:MAG: class I SAM-dependent methyltransferase [Actinomycetota bacterium]|nr:class I SAM-dependent methyltransferase [Actinomycetota bacterium]MDQ2981278.1 class I SAM-dependent methyltransferase [Actinomycetota bacterium]
MVSRGELYDAIEESHDYEADAERLHALIQDRFPGAKTLLDVACGTGRHLPFLASHYETEGVDVDPDYLEVARRRVPDAAFHERDMAAFDLGRQYDVVLCMGSAIGYVRTRPRLQQTIATLAHHLVPRGLLIIEPFVPPRAGPSNLGAGFSSGPRIRLRGPR